jgi:hypothetical protein
MLRHIKRSLDSRKKPGIEEFILEKPGLRAKMTGSSTQWLANHGMHLRMLKRRMIDAVMQGHILSPLTLTWRKKTHFYNDLEFDLLENLLHM